MLFRSSPLLVFNHFQVLLLSSSFQQNWFHAIWTSFAKVTDFPVCENKFLILPIYFYNIFLDYDVSLHILVVLVVTIPTSPRLSKTESICKSYGVLFLLLDLPRRWSGVSGPCFSLPNDFVWCGTGLGSGGTPEMDRSLRPCPDDPATRSLAGMSGTDRSLRSLTPEFPA